MIEIKLSFPTISEAAAFLAAIDDDMRAANGEAPPVASPPKTSGLKISAAPGPVGSGGTGAAAAPAADPKAYEKSGIAGLIVDAKAASADETRAVFAKFGALTEDGKPDGKKFKPADFDAVRDAFKAVIGKAAEQKRLQDHAAAAIAKAAESSKDKPPTYDESGIRELIQSLQTKYAKDEDGEADAEAAKAAARKKLAEMIKSFGGVNAEGKAHGASIPSENFEAAKTAFQALLAD